MHDPPADKYVAVAVAEHEGALFGYVAWHVDMTRRHGEIEIVAVTQQQRRCGIGMALCQHAFAEMRNRGAEVVTIGTGGDAFHASARAWYSALGRTATAHHIVLQTAANQGVPGTPAARSGATATSRTSTRSGPGAAQRGGPE